MAAHNTIEFADPTWKRGFTMVPNHILRAEGLSSGAKLVLALLMMFGREKHSAYPGQVKMSRYAQCTEKTLRGYIEELVTHQLVDVKRRGKGVTNLYILHPEREVRPVKTTGPHRPVKITDKEYAEEEAANRTLERGSGGKPLDAARRVWDHYVAVMKPRRVEMSSEEAQVIKKVLEVADEDECRTCIDHCFASDYHMKRGRYSDRPGGKYNALSHILRGRRGKETTRERIDWWLDRDESVSGSPTVPSERDVKIDRARRNLQRVVDGTQDPEIVADGEQAKAYLSEINQQWHVEDGRVKLL